MGKNVLTSSGLIDMAVHSSSSSGGSEARGITTDTCGSPEDWSSKMQSIVSSNFEVPVRILGSMT